MAMTLDGRQIPVEINRRFKEAESQIAAFNRRLKASTVSGLKPSDTKSIKDLPRESLPTKNNGLTEAERTATAVRKINAETVRQAQQQARFREQIAERTARTEVEAERRKGRDIKDALQTELKDRQTVAREAIRAAKEQAREEAQSSRDRRGLGSSIRSAGVGLSAAVTAPIVLGVKYILDVGKQYETAMNVLQVATHATAEEMKRVDAVAVALGADLTLPVTSASDAAGAMLELGKAGFTVTQAMDAARGVLQLAAAANVEEAKAAEINANALNTFSLAAKESSRVADLLAASANASSAEITDNAQALQQAGAVYASSKVPIEDLITLIGTMANAGIKGSDAGTSLKTMLMRLQAPTDNAAGAMQQLGIKVFDAQGKLIPFRSIVELVSTKLAKLTDEQKAQALQTIFGQDAMRAATVIFGKGTEAFDKMKTAVTQQGAAAEMAAARTKGLGGAWEGLKSQVETLALILYQQFKGPIEAALRTVADFVGRAGAALAEFAKAHPTIILVAGAFTILLAAVGPVMIAVGALVALFSGPVLAAIGAVAAAVALFAGAWATNFGGIRDTTQAVIGWIVGFVQGALAQLQAFWQESGARITEVAGEAWNAVKGVVVEVAGSIVAWVQENWPLIRDIAVQVFMAVYTAVKDALTLIVGFFEAHGAKLMMVIQPIWEAVKGIIGAALTAIGNVIKLVLAVINGDWGAAWEALKGLVVAAFKGIVAFLYGIGAAIVGALKAAFAAAWELGGWLYNKALALGRAVWDGIKAGIGSVLPGNAFSGLHLGIKGAIDKTHAQLESKSPSKVFMRLGLSIPEGLAHGIRQGFDEVESSMQDLLDLTIQKFSTRQRVVGTSADDKARESILSALKDANDFLTEMRGGISNLEAVNNFLKDPNVAKQVDKNTAAMLRNIAAMRDASKLTRERKVFGEPPVESRERRVFGDRDDLFDSTRGDLNDKLHEGIVLTERQRMENLLLTKAYDELSEAQREDLINLADHVDLFNETRGQAEQTREEIERFTDSLLNIGDRALDELFEGRIKGMLSEIGNGFKNLFLSIIKDYAMSGLKNVLDSIFNPKSNSVPSSGQGGGFSLSNIWNSIRGTFGGGGGGVGAGGQRGGLLSRIGGFLGFGGGGGGAAASAASSGAANAVGTIGAGTMSAGTFAGAVSGVAPGVAGAGTLFGAGGTLAAGGAAAGAGGGAAAGAGAAGGGSMFSGLMPLLTNPWTAVAVGAAVGGLLLWRHFRNGTEKKLREAIKSAYGVDIKDMAVLSQIKLAGEAQFGKGNVGKHINEVIRLDSAKELIRNYAESTGQDASKLTLNADYSDPNFKGNQFIRNADSGGSSSIQSISERLRAQAASPSASAQGGSASSNNSSTQGKGGIPAVLMAAIVGVIQGTREALVEFNARTRAISKGKMLEGAIEENPEAVVDGFNEATSRGHKKDETLTNLGFRN
jgi:TP901 family phage tail tape measure protein